MPSLDEATFRLLSDLRDAETLALVNGPGSFRGRGLGDETAVPLLDGGLITTIVEYRRDDVEMNEPQAVFVLTEAGRELLEIERGERLNQEASLRPEGVPQGEVEPTTIE